MKELNIGKARKDIGKIVKRTVWPIATMGIAGISVIGCNPFDRDKDVVIVISPTPTPTETPTKMPEATATPTVLATPTTTRSSVDVNVNVNVDVKTQPTATPKPTDAPTPEPTKTPTPKPTRTPEPTRTPTRTPRPEAGLDFTFRSLKPGETWFAEKGDIMIGDGAVNGQVVNDQDAKSGLIATFSEKARVDAHPESGLDILHPNPGANRAKIIAQQIEEMGKTGCGNGCNRVDVISVPGQTQRQVAEPAPTATPRPAATATPRPTDTPTPRPTPTETPRPDLGRPIDFNRGETRTVSGRTVVSGDVKVNGIKLFDDLTDTALIVNIENAATVEAPFGASGLTDFRTDSGLDRETEKIVRQKLTDFREVTVKTIRDGRVIGSRTFTREGLVIDNP